MINALGEPRSVLLLVGTSDIALAPVRPWARTWRPRVVLDARPGERRTTADETAVVVNYVGAFFRRLPL